MSEAFLNALKWYFICICIILGTASFIVSNEQHSVAPIGLGVLGYGIAYIMASYWKNFRGKLLFASLASFIALTVVSPYVETPWYIFFGSKLMMDPFYLWALFVGAAGIPIMTIVFRKMD